MHTELNTLALIIEVSVIIAFTAAWIAGSIWLVGQLDRRNKHNDQ